MTTYSITNFCPGWRRPLVESAGDVRMTAYVIITCAPPATSRPCGSIGCITTTTTTTIGYPFDTILAFSTRVLPCPSPICGCSLPLGSSDKVDGNCKSMAPRGVVKTATLTHFPSTQHLDACRQDAPNSEAEAEYPDFTQSSFKILRSRLLVVFNVQSYNACSGFSKSSWFGRY